jgi:hypothetical protein
MNRYRVPRFHPPISPHVSYDPQTGNMTGQLVDSDYHSFPHRGGVNEYEKSTGCKYLP